MRIPVAVLLVAATGFSQHLSVGVKAGVPMTDLLDTPSGRFPYVSATKRYTIGPTLDIRLPWRLGVEFDVLYKHFNYGRDFTDTTTVGNLPVTVNGRTSGRGNSWEFPLLLKFRLADGPLIRPYVAAGANFNRISAKEVTEFFTPSGASARPPQATDNPSQLSSRSGRGFVMGAGLDVSAWLVHLTPELRYTRWGVANFRDINSLLNSNQNQAEFLLGITF